MITPIIAKTVPQIIQAISLGPTNPSEKGPCVVLIILTSGKIILGSYSDDEPNITSPNEVLENTPELRELVDALLVNGTEFVTETNPEESCRLKWEITAVAK